MSVGLVALRLAGAFVVLCAMGVAGVVASLLLPRRARRAVLGASLRSGCFVLLRTLGVAPVMRGPRPARGSLIAANHLSWIDIPVVLATWPCTFVAKSEVQRWPLIGALGTALGVIWIDRSRPRDLLRVIPLVEGALRRGESVLLFPEGTTTNGQSMGPFRSGLFEAAVRARATVSAVAISVSAAGGDPDALCWYGAETLVANIVRVASLRGARCTVHGSGPLHDGLHSSREPAPDRKDLARAARREAVRRFQSVVRQDQGVSVRAKQNLRPIESSEREIFA